MKKIMILFIIIICFPAFTFAGEIYGNIKVGERPIGMGIKVEITPTGDTTPAEDTTSAGDTTYVTYTDTYSSYSIYVEETGRYELTVYYEDPHSEDPHSEEPHPEDPHPEEPHPEEPHPEEPHLGDSPPTDPYPSIIVYSYQESIRYNLILIQSSEGKYYLRRQ